MSLTNYEKQKRWREKNRALYNLQQRNRRKKNLSGEVAQFGRAVGKLAQNTTTVAGSNPAPSAQKPLSSGLSGGEEVADVIQSLPPAQSKDETLERLKGLIKVEEEKPGVEAPVRLPMRRSDTGMIITEEQYQEREEYKRRSREKGFVPDEYSQA